MELWKYFLIYQLFVMMCWTWREISGVRLSEYIEKYEVLKYNTNFVHSQHQRVKRSYHSRDKELGIKFNSHGKSFHLRLRRDTTTISPNVQVEMPAYLGTLDTSHIYEGTLSDDGNSRVWGSVRDGVFEGVIASSDDGTFYVEHAYKYFPRHNSTHAGFHSVIYHDSDVRDPYMRQRQGPSSGCGMSRDVEQWMQSIQNGAVSSEDEEEECDDVDDWTRDSHYLPPEYKAMAGNLALHKAGHDFALRKKYEKIAKQMKKDYHDKYSASSNRHKRSISDLGIGANNKGTCTLSIQTDPRLWHHIYKTLNDVDRTKDEISAMISQHVRAINSIYGDVIFEEGRYKHQGIRFEVQRIKIEDETSSCSPTNGAPSDFCVNNVDVSNFLNLHSKTDHDAFCLAYVFTFRDFTGGTLGLAWVASPSGASGGICEKYKTYTENVAGFRRTEKRSLNTGIITFLNYNNRVPPKVSQLTLAHEIGHNFGSPHDYPERCKPGGLNGNYIMFSSATSGDRPNNSKFSPCSVRNITKVLDAIILNHRKNCFQESDGAYCGNKIVEEGEECDCGYNEEECDEKCCYPKLISLIAIEQNETAKPCARKAKTECSPSEGPCCVRNSCKFDSNFQCHGDSDCTRSSNCSGRSAKCPKPNSKNDLSYCNKNTKVCLNGECSGSICLAHGMKECFLTSDLVQDKKKLCEIACHNDIDQICKSTSELLSTGSYQFTRSVFMRPGAPCNNFQGYCDVFQKCRAVDAEGPLARLKNLFFSEDTINSITEWITQYWYAVLLIGVAFVVVMGLFLKCCAIHTPSSNPNKPAARSISETLRRPVNTLRRVKRNRNIQQSGGGGGSSGGGRSHHHHHHDDQYQHHQLQNQQPGPSSRSSREDRREQRSSSGGSRKDRKTTPVVEPVAPVNRVSQDYTDEPPPPYPGSRPPPTRHGYGEGRGHYNRPKGNKKNENSAV